MGKDNTLLVKYFTLYGNLIFLNFFVVVELLVLSAITVGLTGIFMNIVLLCMTRALLLERIQSSREKLKFWLIYDCNGCRVLQSSDTDCLDSEDREIKNDNDFTVGYNLNSLIRNN